VNTEDALAVTYNDKSVLENMHCAAAFTKMKSNNFMEDVHRDTYQTLRSQIISMVLATDPSRHFTDLAKFKGMFTSRKIDDENKTHL
jgi:hypothetical protein